MAGRFYSTLLESLRRSLVPLMLLMVVGGVYAVAMAKSLDQDVIRYSLPAWGPSKLSKPESAARRVPDDGRGPIGARFTARNHVR